MKSVARCTVLVAGVLIALALCPNAAFAEPAFFSDLPYAKAKASATENEKLFFVKATAVWCGPCKMMDRTTFTDQRVIDWLNEKAVCVSVDVDDEPELAGRLGIRAMPTTILFRGDEELARVVGYRDGDGLLSWLTEAEGGAVVPAAERPRPPADDIKGRLDRARELVRAGERDAATEEYVWLWKNIPSLHPMTGVRASFMAMEMSRLAKSHPPARAAFTGLRDETEDRLFDAERKSWDDLRDWLVLNERVLHERKPIRDWIDRIKDRPTAKRTFERTRDIIEDMLIDEGEWALIGELIDDPFADIEMQKMIAELEAERLAGMDEARREELEVAERRRFAKRIGRTAAALLAAGREIEAKQVAFVAAEFQDDTVMRASIVAHALDAEQPRAWHLDLLDGVEADAAEKLAPMRAAVEAALSG